MKYVKTYEYGPVKSYELAYSPFGKPLMSVRFYAFDEILVDTGQSHMQQAVLDIVKRLPVLKIALTHHHEDHSGNAAALQNIKDVSVLGHELTVQKMKHQFKILPYQHFVWGQATPLKMQAFKKDIQSSNYKLTPIHTPGHSKDHVAYLEADQGWLFSGDLYLGDRIKYFRVDEKITDQIASIKKVLSYDFESLFCAHHPQLKGGRQRLAAKLQYLEDIYGNVASRYYQGYSPGQIFKQLQLEEATFVKVITLNNVSMANMVKSAVLALKAGS